MAHEQEAEILERAADLIQVHGHVKRQFGNPETGFCVIGAIMHAEDVQLVARSRARRLFEVAIPKEYSIVDWNDADTRTAEEVIDLMKSVAKDLRNAS